MRRVISDQSRRVSHWVGSRMGSTWDGAMAIGLEQDGELIAGVVYDDFNGANINMHVAATGRNWMTRAYLHFCFWYPFEQLKVKRVTGLVPAVNMAARKFDEHLGFELEARLVKAHPQGDLLVYRMFRSQCRWLSMRVNYGQVEQSASCA